VGGEAHVRVEDCGNNGGKYAERGKVRGKKGGEREFGKSGGVPWRESRGWSGTAKDPEQFSRLDGGRQGTGTQH